MRTNSTATLYRYNPVNKTYTRVLLGAVWWEWTQGINYLASNIGEDDKAVLFVPDTSIDIKADGYSRIVKGDLTREIDENYTITNLAQDYDTFKITACNKLENGSKPMWHWELTLK
ncbi:MAG: DUF6751 family protein [Christensenellaceae bacterium]|jgi:hypothetical protein